MSRALALHGNCAKGTRTRGAGGTADPANPAVYTIVQTKVTNIAHSGTKVKCRGGPGAS